jgi:hypothetical protein
MWLDPHWEDRPTAPPEHAHIQAERGASGKIMSSTRKRGILPVREKGSKSRWETNERKTHLCIEQALLERYFLSAPSPTTQKKTATQGYGKPWRDQVPMNSPVSKSKQAHDFKTTKRHYCSLPNFPPNILCPLYKNSIFLVDNSQHF